MRPSPRLYPGGVDTLPPIAVNSSELTSGLSIIASLVLIEGLLSVDNVLGIAAIARSLPETQRKQAIRLGMAGAYVFRIVALIFVGILKDNLWVRWLGAGYLIYLMCSQLTKPQAPHDLPPSDHDTALNHDMPDGAGAVSTPAGKALTGAAFGAVLLQIGLMDLSLSVDNVITAVALAGNTMWAIYVGVLIAILALQFLTGVAMSLLDRYPVLEPTAFILIGFVGVILVVESATHQHFPPWVKFVGILAILALSLLWDRSPAVKKFSAPLFKAVRPAMKAFAIGVGLIFKPLELLLSGVRKMLVRKTSASTGSGS